MFSTATNNTFTTAALVASVCVNCKKLRPSAGFPQGIKDHLTKVCFLCWNLSFTEPLFQGRASVRITLNKLEGSGLKCVSHSHQLRHEEVSALFSHANWARYNAIFHETFGLHREVLQSDVVKVTEGLQAIAAAAAPPAVRTRDSPNFLLPDFLLDDKYYDDDIAESKSLPEHHSAPPSHVFYLPPSPPRDGYFPQFASPSPPCDGHVPYPAPPSLPHGAYISHPAPPSQPHGAHDSLFSPSPPHEDKPTPVSDLDRSRFPCAASPPHPIPKRWQDRNLRYQQHRPLQPPIAPPTRRDAVPAWPSAGSPPLGGLSEARREVFEAIFGV